VDRLTAAVITQAKALDDGLLVREDELFEELRRDTDRFLGFGKPPQVPDAHWIAGLPAAAWQLIRISNTSRSDVIVFIVQGQQILAFIPIQHLVKIFLQERHQTVQA
jgi:hypothetical protein